MKDIKNPKEFDNSIHRVKINDQFFTMEQIFIWIEDMIKFKSNIEKYNDI